MLSLGRRWRGGSRVLSLEVNFERMERIEKLGRLCVRLSEAGFTECVRACPWSSCRPSPAAGTCSGATAPPAPATAVAPGAQGPAPFLPKQSSFLPKSPSGDAFLPPTAISIPQVGNTQEQKVTTGTGNLAGLKGCGSAEPRPRGTAEAEPRCGERQGCRWTSGVGRGGDAQVA